MKLKFTIWASAALLSLDTTARAQQTAVSIKTEYLDSASVVLPSAQGAAYRCETEQVDAEKGFVRTFGMDGRRVGVREVEFQQGRPVAHGVAESWFENGQLRLHEEYMHGHRQGEMRLYYPSGQLKRRARYTKDFTSTGECFAADGQAVPFFEYEKLPVYPAGDGGPAAVVYAIQRGVKYPKDAIKAGKAGRVLVSFNVTKTGEVANVRVIEGVFPSLDEQVVQSIQRLKPFTPGQQDGEPIGVPYTIPVMFALQ
ncbi:energy transducer TonB [Hymenobacter properus]|uniref:TonB family protein n=1 Tax=Hymenobacter properus TaxID=2791026 RepID=A0A931BAL4_9BACT|nr:energy transducer TonB [Hymenobacter properus]MBF9140229.1 TonB family protein [Hymenobacter properus]MBR7719036.1 TonB family protein [Microvirga sp. SRT04]